MDNFLHRNMWWIRDPVNPVLPPGTHDFDCGCCMNPWVLRADDQYRLYYAGADAEGHRNICLATAPADRPTEWTRHGIVMARGSEGAFDHNWAVLPHVLRFPDRWHLYYTGNCGHGAGLSAFPGIGLAFSEDGISWTKHEGNPILTPSGREGDPDCHGIAGGSVLNVRRPDGVSEWRFYYTGCPTLGDDVFLDQQKTVCCAVSEDGVHWEKRGAVMFREPERDYVNIAAAGPVVWQDDDGMLRMVYSAIGTRWGYYSICYAESEDGVSWRRGEHDGDDLTLGPTGNGWERQMVEYPSVIREGRRLRMFYCGNGYGGSGIGTATAGPLRATAVHGPCRINLTSHEARACWAYRTPEGLSCDEGVFKSHGYPLLDWHGPTAEGRLWHEYEIDEQDLAVNNADTSLQPLGLRFTAGISYRMIVDHSEYGLALKFTAANRSAQTFHNVVGVPCLGTPSDSFRDPDLERTFVLTSAGLTRLKDTDRGTGDPCRTHYLVEGQPAIRFCGKSFWGELSATPLKCGAILRTSVDGRFTVGTVWDAVAEVWDNQDAHGCIHSNFALGHLAPGETKSVKGRVVLAAGGPEAALELLNKER